MMGGTWLGRERQAHNCVGQWTRGELTGRVTTLDACAPCGLLKPSHMHSLSRPPPPPPPPTHPHQVSASQQLTLLASPQVAPLHCPTQTHPAADLRTADTKARDQQQQQHLSTAAHHHCCHHHSRQRSSLHRHPLAPWLMLCKPAATPSQGTAESVTGPAESVRYTAAAAVRCVAHPPTRLL